MLAKEAEGIPFVQANLLDSLDDDPAEVERWREDLRSTGCGRISPCRCFPIPGRPITRVRWGAADDWAWERAHDFYLGRFDEFSDIQEQRPAPLVQLELAGGVMREPRHRRVLMTTDTVGGVWTFALELARGLAEEKIEVVLAALGGDPSAEQSAEASAIPGLCLLAQRFQARMDGNPWADVEASGRWLMRSKKEYQPGSGSSEFVRPRRSSVARAGGADGSFVRAFLVGCGAAAARAGFLGPISRRSYLGARTRSDLVAAPSSAMAESVRRHYGRVCEVIPNGSNRPRDFSARKKSPSFLPREDCGMRRRM